MDKRQVIRSTGTVGVFILLSRFFGMIRDMLMAATFGASLGMSAFLVAFQIPNTFRSLFGEGALSAAYVPVFTEKLEKEGLDKVWTFAARMMSVLGLVLAAVTALGIALSTLAQAVLPLAPMYALILELLNIMLPYMFFICLTAFFSAMLNSLKSFALPAATPVLMNLTMIAAIGLGGPWFRGNPLLGIHAMAWSVIVAGVLQMLVQLPELVRRGFRPALSFDWRDPGVRRVFALMGTAAVGMGMPQINVLLTRLLSAAVSEGAPTYLYLSERLIYLPLGIFGTALGTVLLPAFSSLAAQGQTDRMREMVNHSLRNLLFVMVPASAGLLALAKPITRLLYEHGVFTAHSTDMTAWALACYAPGLVAFGLLKVFVPVFYALQDMRTPVRMALLGTGLTLLLILILVGPMEHAGIALATVLAQAVTGVLLGRLVHRRLGSPGWKNIFYSFARILVASAAMGGAAYGFNGLLEAWLAGLALPAVVKHGVAVLGSIALAGLLYLAAALLLRCPELAEIRSALRRVPAQPPVPR
ncbi:MAG: murein biosynthesis integral membrane protein MurJ [Lentisphaerae bacterium]|nr:murein biosynthesis integral membrane protein MurJ [Lentisphaerota bacterium]